MRGFEVAFADGVTVGVALIVGVGVGPAVGVVDVGVGVGVRVFGIDVGVGAGVVAVCVVDVSVGAVVRGPVLAEPSPPDVDVVPRFAHPASEAVTTASESAAATARVRALLLRPIRCSCVLGAGSRRVTSTPDRAGNRHATRRSVTDV